LKKLAIVTTHPIQYYSPLFKLLNQHKQIEIKVFYTWGNGALNKFDPGFGKNIQWDIPLLEGYPFEWVYNSSNNPGSEQFNGIVNPNLIERIKAYAPDKILIYGWAYYSHLKIIRYFKNKIPIIFRGDSTLLDTHSVFKNFVKSCWLKWVYSHVNYALYVGKNNKFYFEKYGLKEKQLNFAPHAIDNERFAIDKKSESALLRKMFEIADNNVLIMFAGKLEEKKDPLLLLEAFLHLNKKKAHLLFVGNGKLENQLKNKAEAQNNVHFLDFQNQSYMPVLYQACDIFCLPSKGPSETWGLALNEAMACKSVVLASDKVGSAIDLIIPGQNGYIFKNSSIDDLSDKLGELLNKELSELELMGLNSKILISEWNFQKQAKVIEFLTKDAK
jgi:glycosyltransferase involved in cell wall biosynthesis